MARPSSRHDAVNVLFEVPGLGILMAYGNTVPANGAKGYAKGCLWLKTDATTIGTALYQNIGTKENANFQAHS